MTPALLVMALQATPAAPAPASPAPGFRPARPAEPPIFGHDVSRTHVYPAVVSTWPSGLPPMQPYYYPLTPALMTHVTDTKFRRIVFANRYTLDIGLFAAPCGDFLGFMVLWSDCRHFASPVLRDRQ